MTADERKARPPGRRPDYVLSVLDKTTGESCKVGVGWINDGEKGQSISIRLNLCTTLTSDRDMVIALFVNDELPEGTPAPLYRRRKQREPLSEDFTLPDDLRR